MPLFHPPNIEKLKTKRDVRGLMKVLKDSTAYVTDREYAKTASARAAATAALTEIGGPAVDALIQAFDGANSNMRECIVAALGGIGDSRALELLTTALEERWGVSVKAARALSRLRDPRAVPALAKVSKKPGGSSLDAIEALEAIGAPAVDALIEVMRSVPDNRLAAARALGQIGDSRAVEPLTDALKDSNPTFRQQVAKALGSIGGAQAKEALVRVLREDPACEVTQAAAEALQKLGWTPNRENLVAFAFATRNWAILKDAGEESIAPLMNRVGALRKMPGLDWKDYGEIASALVALGISAKDTGLDFLLETLHSQLTKPVDHKLLSWDNLSDSGYWEHVDEYLQERLGAREWAKTIIQGCLKNKDSLGLARMLHLDDAEVREYTAKVLGETGDATVAQYLIADLEKHNPTSSYGSCCHMPLARAWYATADALAKLGPPAVESLLSAVNKPEGTSWRVYDAIVRALQTMTPPATAALVEVLKNPNAEIRSRVLRALRDVGDPQTVRAILTVIAHDADKNVRENAASALAHIGAVALPELVEVLGSNLDPQLRAAAAETLGNLRDPRAEKSLTEAADSQNPEVRRAAAQALEDVTRERAYLLVLWQFSDPPSADGLDYILKTTSLELKMPVELLETIHVNEPLPAQLNDVIIGTATSSCRKAHPPFVPSRDDITYHKTGGWDALGIATIRNKPTQRKSERTFRAIGEPSDAETGGTG